MMLRRRLIPVTALVVAIGASAAGAATAAETGSGTAAGGGHQSHKPVACKVLLPGGVKGVKKGSGSGKVILPRGGDAAAAAKAAAAAQSRIGLKGDRKPPSGECRKKVAEASLDTVAAKLGVSKAALVQALTETKQWIIASGTKPTVAQFEQHLADLLHIPVAKVDSVFGSAPHIAVSPGA